MKKTTLMLLIFAALANSLVAQDVLKPAELHSRDEEAKDIIQLVREQGVDTVDLHFTDMLGNLKSYTVMTSMLPSVFTKGVFFDGSSVKGYSALSASDLKLMPDLSTFRIMPWAQGGQTSASVMCDIYGVDGKPYPYSPRTILKRVVEEAKQQGYTFNVSPEIEFFLYKKDESKESGIAGIDTSDYCDVPYDGKAHVVKLQMLKMLDVLGMNPEKTHHEVAPDQHEITLRYDNALDMADKLILVKWVMHFVARYQGYEVTFMPKPVVGENGSGMHLNYSLWDDKTGKNAFFDGNEQFCLSTLAQKFIAGNLAHIQAMTALLNPVANSYRRLVPGYEAPVYVAWGSRNRSTLIRIPIVNDGEENAVRAEMRSPDAMCNPYLAFAAILKSGLDGMAGKAAIRKPTTENLFKLSFSQISERGIKCLPGNLEEASKAMMGSVFMNSFLSEEFVRRYIQLKAKEIDSEKMTVTQQDWERNFSA